MGRSRNPHNRLKTLLILVSILACNLDLYAQIPKQTLTVAVIPSQTRLNSRFACSRSIGAQLGELWTV